MQAIAALQSAVTTPHDTVPSKGRVLVVEDNLINQRVAAILLSKLGYTPDLAADGKEAVEKFAINDYDVVLMDCMMPVMDGFEATAAIRAMDNPKSKTPIIAVTANALAGQREKCLDAGMNEYIAKPISRDALEKALLRFMHPEELATLVPTN